jgi:hypothetical protein
MVTSRRISLRFSRAPSKAGRAAEPGTVPGPLPSYLQVSASAGPESRAWSEVAPNLVMSAESQHYRGGRRANAASSAKRPESPHEPVPVKKLLGHTCAFRRHDEGIWVCAGVRATASRSPPGRGGRADRADDLRSPLDAGDVVHASPLSMVTSPSPRRTPGNTPPDEGRPCSSPIRGAWCLSRSFTSRPSPDLTPGIWTVWRLRIRPTVTSPNGRVDLFPLRGRVRPRGDRGGHVSGAHQKKRPAGLFAAESGSGHGQAAPLGLRHGLGGRDDLAASARWPPAPCRAMLAADREDTLDRVRKWRAAPG